MKEEKNECIRRVEARVDGVIVRGVISSDCKRVRILLHDKDGPIPAGEIDLSEDTPVFRFKDNSINLTNTDICPNIAGMPLWFDFLEKVALVLPEPYRSRLELARAALIALMLKNEGR